MTIPPLASYFRAYIRRDGWASRGPGGIVQPVEVDGVPLKGLDTEVVRCSFWVNYGTGWEFAGHIGTTGGDFFGGKRGDLFLDTIYGARLKQPDNPFRQFKVTLDCGERLSTSVEVEFSSRPNPSTRRDIHHSIAVRDADIAEGVSGTTVSTPNIDTAGSDRYIVGFASNERYPTDRNLTSLSFGAAAMTARWSNEAGGGMFNNAAELVAPSETAAPVTVVWAAGPDHSTVAGVSFTGVDQDTPSDSPITAATGSGTTPTATVTKGEDGDVRIALFTSGVVASPALTVGANETDRANAVNGSGNYQVGFMVTTKEDDGTDDMNGTIASSAAWYVRGWNINMAGATTTVKPRSLLLTGVGC